MRACTPPLDLYTNMDVAQEIIALRTQHKLTQIAFAKRIGVCPASVRGWESGQYKPSLKRLEAIDITFGSTLAEKVIAEMPNKPKRRRSGYACYPNLPAFTDDVEVFKTIITLLKLFMLLNPEGREKTIRKITAYANDERYVIPRMANVLQEHRNTGDDTDEACDDNCDNQDEPDNAGMQCEQDDETTKAS